MGHVESSWSPLAWVIPELQSAISNSIKVQGELDARVQKMESGVPSHHMGNIDGLISKVEKMHSRCEYLDNRVNGIHDVIDGLKTSHNASMVALKTNVATSLHDNTANVTCAYENTIGDLHLQTGTRYEVLSSHIAKLEAGDNARRVDAIEKKLEDVEKKLSLHVGVSHEDSSSPSPSNLPPNPPPHSFDVPMLATNMEMREERVHQFELAGQIVQGPVPVDLSSAVREFEDKFSGIIERFQVQALELEETLEFRLPDASDTRESQLLARIEELQAQIFCAVQAIRLRKAIVMVTIATTMALQLKNEHRYLFSTKRENLPDLQPKRKGKANTKHEATSQKTTTHYILLRSSNVEKRGTNAIQMSGAHAKQVHNA